jgi:hypothetical protein
LTIKKGCAILHLRKVKNFLLLTIKRGDKMKTYIIEFVHWRKNQPQEIHFDCENQFEALAEFKRIFGKVNFEACCFANFNMKTL